MDKVQPPPDPNEARTQAARKAMGVLNPTPEPGSFRGTVTKRLAVEDVAKKLSDAHQLREAEALERYNARVRASRAAEGVYRAQGTEPPSGMVQREGNALDAEQAQVLLDAEKPLREGPTRGQWLGEPREEHLIERADPNASRLSDETIPWRTAEEVQKEKAAGVYGPPEHGSISAEVYARVEAEIQAITRALKGGQ